MTPQGRDWFTLATDPFHDYEVHVAGYPDHYHDSTVVLYDKRVVRVTAPANLAAGDTWQAHFYTLPLLRETLALYFFDAKQNFLDSVALSGDGLPTMATLNIATSADGVPLFPTTELTPGEWGLTDPDDTRRIRSVPALEGENPGMGRLIAGGFEVHNDTPDLYRGGSVTVYTAPQEASDPYNMEIREAENTLVSTVANHKGIPASVSEASIYRSSRTWEASQGCLVPFQLNLDQDGLAFKAKPDVINVFRSGENARASGMMPVFSAPDGAILSAAKVPMRKAALDTTGAFFSGLHANSVLTLSVKTFVELAPTNQQPTVLKLSSPSATMDEHAIRCYQHCVAKLPPGVPVGMNAKGDWWRMVLKTLQTSAPAIQGVASAVAPEYAKQIASARQLAEKGVALALKNSQKRADDRKAATAKPNQSMRKRK